MIINIIALKTVQIFILPIIKKNITNIKNKFS